MKVILLFLLLACGVAQAVPPLDFDNQYGHFMITNFASAPFPHPGRANGHKYHQEFYSAADHYSDSTVGLFVPTGFRATDKIDFVVHFHGWRHTVGITFIEYQLPEQFYASGRNAILIVPQGPYGAPDSFGGKLEDTNGFARFIAEAMADLKSDGLVSNSAAAGDIILSAHSGGYETMFNILDHGGLSDQIREVWMFDCLYAGSDQFMAWAAREIGQKNAGRLLDIYTDHGGTLEDSQAMVAALQKQGAAVISTNDLAVTPAMLTANRYVFMHSDLPHDDVMARRKTFQEFLETSFLAPIKQP